MAVGPKGQAFGFRRQDRDVQTSSAGARVNQDQHPLPHLAETYLASPTYA